MILEKRPLPRPKACGGALPASAEVPLDCDVRSLAENEVRTIRYLYDHRRPVVSKHQKTVLYMVDRSSFDYHLVKHAVSLGHGNVIVRDAFEVERIEEGSRAVSLRSGGETIRSTYVIAADGALGRTARCLGIPQPTIRVLALDARVEVAPALFDTLSHQATFNLFCLSGGYGWIFPKQGYLSCGVGSWQNTRHQRLPGMLKHFLSRSIPPDKFRIVKQRVHPVPIYDGNRQIATQRICLAGDAACLVEPIMGEGLRYAIESGRLAAEVIAHLMNIRECLSNLSAHTNGKIESCRAYQRLLHEGRGRDFDLLYRFGLPLFLDAPDFFYRKFIEDGINYTAYFRQVAARIRSLHQKRPDLKPRP